MLENPSIKRAGTVPRAKKNIIKNPCNALPDIKASPWAVIVNPQGRKKVEAPKKQAWLFTELLSLVVNFLKNPPFLNFKKSGNSNPSIFKEKKIISSETIKTKKEVKPRDILNTFPSPPRTAPNNQ